MYMYIFSSIHIYTYNYIYMHHYIYIHQYMNERSCSEGGRQRLSDAGDAACKASPVSYLGAPASRPMVAGRVPNLTDEGEGEEWGHATCKAHLLPPPLAIEEGTTLDV